MNRFIPPPFTPPFWLTNPHLQTILPKLCIKPTPDYRRELVNDSFGSNQVAYDFLDSHEDFADSQADLHADSQADSQTSKKYQKPLVVLFHGLEGSSQSHYAITLAHHIHSQGWHFVVAHYRSCGGVSVSGDIFYNAGDTDEVHHVLTVLSQRYETIYAIGVSLGGNMLAKYMGQYGAEALCKRAVVASAPVDLSSSATAMQQFMGKRLYTPYLLNPLVKKALAVHLDSAERQAIQLSKNIYEFDHAFTAPRHGYRSVNDYYKRASALPSLLNITKPTLMVTAKDDPFLGVTATPEDVSKAVTLLDTKHGGHIGFVRYDADAKGKDKLNLTWLAETAMMFFRLNPKV